MLKISNKTTKPSLDNRTPLEYTVYTLLDKLNIPFEQVDNDSACSMDECVEISNFLGAQVRKTVFLCNQKKTVFYLLVMAADKPFNTSVFCKSYGCSRVSFASSENMGKLLGVTPGSASIMSLVNDKENKVQLAIDKDIIDDEWFACNPGINTSHIKFSTKLLIEVFLPYINHEAKIVNL